MGLRTSNVESLRGRPYAARMDDTTTSPPSDAAGAVRPVDLRDYVDFSQDHARQVRVFTTDRLALDLWCLEPQQATPVLHHPDADVTYTVVGGRSWFVTDQGEIGLDPMGAVLVPAGTVHGIDNRGADPLIVSASMAPPDDLTEDVATSAGGLAVRDDSQYGQLGERVKATFGRLLGR